MKKRLDVLVHERFPCYSRRQIQSWIMQAKVRVNGIPVSKPGISIGMDASIELLVDEQDSYVSRAGCKLACALERFAIDVTDLTVLDAGLSTGGFTDCLLQHGARHVFGVDVGYGQVHEKIRSDTRVTVIERTNVRYLHSVGQLVDLITLDLSFISVLKVMDAVTALLACTGQLLVLIKPQFEAARNEVRRGGLITDSVVHQRIIKAVITGIETYGFRCIGWTESCIQGATGNKEFFAYFRRV